MQLLARQACRSGPCLGGGGQGLSRRAARRKRRLACNRRNESLVFACPCVALCLPAHLDNAGDDAKHRHACPGHKLAKGAALGAAVQQRDGGTIEQRCRCAQQQERQPWH